jgi:hypothetical protein
MTRSNCPAIPRVSWNDAALFLFLLFHKSGGDWLNRLDIRRKDRDMQDKLEQDKRVKAPEDEDCPKEEQDLDENLYDTFPASDPATGPQKSDPAGPPTAEEIDRAKQSEKVRKN